MKISAPLARVYLIRHGETAWSLSGRHTGRTDIALTARGETQASHLGESLRQKTFSHVFTSPLIRAQQTCTSSKVLPAAEIDADLLEWNYGDYEGRTTAQIQADRPAWNLFADGAPHGESPADVQIRADRFIRKMRAMDDDIAVFSHGHFLRALAARWIGLAVSQGARLVLTTASLSILGYEHHRAEEPAILLWNATSLGLGDL
jgi:broad specificity phosphatase PhoE